MNEPRASHAPGAARRNGKTAALTAGVDVALSRGEHVHVITRDGYYRCAGGDPGCQAERVYPPSYGMGEVMNCVSVFHEDGLAHAAEYMWQPPCGPWIPLCRYCCARWRQSPGGKPARIRSVQLAAGGGFEPPACGL